jgi:hypothetical protein
MTEKRLTVFLSYAAEDESVAQDLINKLESRGIDTWFDEHNLQPGANWDQTIRHAITHSDYMVAIMPNEKASQYVLFEIGLALGEKKTVIPVAIGGQIDSASFPPISNLRTIRSEDTATAADEIALQIASAGDA